jgi:hypothetical protein
MFRLSESDIETNSKNRPSFLMPQSAPTSAYEPINRDTLADFEGREAAASNKPSKLGQPETLLEELQMVRLEGRYFCFDKHEAKARTGVLEYRDGNRGLVIEVSQRFGHPSLLAYKVLQAVFKKITEAGKPYPDTVVLGQRELGRLVGRDSFGGRDAQQLHQAISQLRNTNVELYLYDDAKDTAVPQSAKAFKTWGFSILANLGFVGTGDATHPQHIHTAVLRLDPTIAENLRAGHFAIYNWERLEGMEPLTAALYKRLYLHLSNLYETQYNRHNLKFEKDYEAICAEWLGGLKPERFKSRIAYQMKTHFDSLRASGLVREVSIEPKVKGGFKLVFKPSDGFFSDYEMFYLGVSNEPKLKAQTKGIEKKTATNSQPPKHQSQQNLLLAPLQAVTHFYQKLHGITLPETPLANDTHNAIYAERDIAFARTMIDKLDAQAFTNLIDFAITQAPLTRFDMKSIRAVETYLVAWQMHSAKQAAKDEQNQRRSEAQRREQKHEQLKSVYDQFCETACEQYVTSLSESERDALRDEALAIVLPQSPAYSKTHRLMLKMTERNLIANRVQVPDFDAWLAMSRMSDSDNGDIRIQS